VLQTPPMTKKCKTFVYVCTYGGATGFTHSINSVSGNSKQSSKVAIISDSEMLPSRLYVPDPCINNFDPRNITNTNR